MEPKYDPQTVEAAAQSHRDRIQAYRAVEHVKDAKGQPKPKFYVNHAPCSYSP